MARAKKTAAPPVIESPKHTAIKVLKGGASWHGGAHDWSLPTQETDGSWTPGGWTPNRTPRLCSTGWHLTNDPGRWWGDGVNVVAYLVEYEGRVDGPSGETCEDPTKFAVERCRLLRPLTHDELITHGIYLTGEHEEISGRAILGGDAHVKRLTGTARIDRMDGTARIDWMDGTARIDRMTGTARIDRMTGTARIDWMDGTARIDWMDGTATAHASGDSIIVVRYGTPTVTLRRRASGLDYRPARPVHLLADDGQVLTLAGDGSVSQAPVADETTAAPPADTSGAA